jgi:hypothetical protein
MPENYVLLERTELNASAASITFANIPQTGYTDLKIVMSTRLDSASGANFNYITFNGVTTGYSVRTLEGSGSSASSANASTRNAGLDEGTSFTSNTFSSTEIYIPNYNSANNKSYSVETVTENNATSAFMELVAGLWSNTAAITSIQIIPDTGGRNFVANSTFSLYGIAALGTTPAIAPKASGGNIIDYDGTYWIHTFLTSGTFTPQVGLTCDYLVVAGGGGGGSHNSNLGGSSGGGAGGLRSTVTATGGGGSLESALSLASNTTYTVTIGAGGAGAVGANGDGSIGGNSVFSTITSNGGGIGRKFTGPKFVGGDGGSGGGGSGYSDSPSSVVNPGGTGMSGQGYAGGGGWYVPGTTDPRGGGGGGAGAVGTTASNSLLGVGGNGVAVSITSSSVTYAGGGGGPGWTANAAGGTGGGGGGVYNGVGVAGTTNLGAGGGGGSAAGGGNGGSGIVIIRYPI